MKFSKCEQLVIDLFADDHGFYDRYSPLALRAKELFQISVGRCLKKEMRGGMAVNTVGIRSSDRFMGKFKSAGGLSDEDLLFASAYHREFSVLYSGEIKNIVNLLYYSINNSEEWLNNVDEFGRPKKLLKTCSIEALSKEAVKYMSRPAYSFYQDATIIRSPKPDPELEPLTDADEEYFADLGMEHSVVRLRTPLALKHEGRVMKNCVGDKNYDRFLGSKNDQLLSVRFKETRLATLHICQSRYGWRIREFFGKRNLNPDEYLIDMISSQNWLTPEEYSSLLHAEFHHKHYMRDDEFDESLINNKDFKP